LKLKKYTDMKKALRIITVMAFLLAAPVFMFAQTPPHPNGGNAPGSGNTPVGGGAPLGGGLIIMMVMGAAYGAKKAYKAFK
jgi:hypothetical protein